TRSKRDWSSDVCSSDLGQILNGAGLLNSIKIIKSDAELAYLRHSAAITSKAVAETRPYIAAGKTDDEIAGKAAQVMLASGSGFKIGRASCRERGEMRRV